MGILRKIEPVYVAPPAEPTAVQQLADLQSRVDDTVRAIHAAIAKMPPDHRCRDVLLDIRLVLAPTSLPEVPVVPGRS